MLGQAQFLGNLALRLAPEEHAEGDLAVSRGKLMTQLCKVQSNRLVEPAVHRMHPPDKRAVIAAEHPGDRPSRDRAVAPEREQLLLLGREQVGNATEFRIITPAQPGNL